MRAEERITQRHPEGQKQASEFWLGGKLVGEAWWDPSGTLGAALGLREGCIYGHLIEYDWDGRVSFAEPHVDGLTHGLTKQWDARGRLLIACPFRRGTGIDFWCYDDGRLAEEHPFVDGKPSGLDRWWGEDQRSIYEETGWLDGKWHGIARRWREGKLTHGHPSFHIRGKRVSKRAYLAAARRDPTLPAYQPEDDRPERPLPERFIQLRARARRLGWSR